MSISELSLSGNTHEVSSYNETENEASEIRDLALKLYGDYKIMKDDWLSPTCTRSESGEYERGKNNKLRTGWLSKVVMLAREFTRFLEKSAGVGEEAIKTNKQETSERIRVLVDKIKSDISEVKEKGGFVIMETKKKLSSMLKDKGVNGIDEFKLNMLLSCVQGGMMDEFIKIISEEFRVECNESDYIALVSDMIELKKRFLAHKEESVKAGDEILLEIISALNNVKDNKQIVYA